MKHRTFSDLRLELVILKDFCLFSFYFAVFIELSTSIIFKSKVNIRILCAGSDIFYKMPFFIMEDFVRLDEVAFSEVFDFDCFHKICSFLKSSF